MQKDDEAPINLSKSNMVRRRAIARAIPMVRARARARAPSFEGHQALKVIGITVMLVCVVLFSK